MGKEKIKQISKSRKFKIGSFFLFLGITLITLKYFIYFISDKEEEIKIREFYTIQLEQIDNNKGEDNTDKNPEVKYSTIETIDDYIAVIKIPKIKLEKGLYLPSSKKNNVNKNISIIKESTFPDVENGNFILAGHSGNSRVSYFKDLYKLEIGDEVEIIFKNSVYKYRVINTYDVLKDGTIDIIRNREKTTLTLITCRQKTDKQIVFICELYDKEELKNE